MTPPTVFIVDDDASARESLAWLIGSVKLPTRVYDSGEAFLREFAPEAPGCVVLDLRLPGASGLAIIEHLATLPLHPPVILVTAYGSVSSTARAMRAGAVHVLEKPYDDQELLDAIHEALQRDARDRAEIREREFRRARFEQLTPREREVLERMVAGKANKVTARELDVSEKNVEFHRANVMKKMQVDSLAELIRIVLPFVKPC